MYLTNWQANFHATLYGPVLIIGLCALIETPK